MSKFNRLFYKIIAIFKNFFHQNLMDIVFNDIYFKTEH